MERFLQHSWDIFLREVEIVCHYFAQLWQYGSPNEKWLMMAIPLGLIALFLFRSTLRDKQARRDTRLYTYKTSHMPFYANFILLTGLTSLAGVSYALSIKDLI